MTRLPRAGLRGGIPTANPGKIGSPIPVLPMIESPVRPARQAVHPFRRRGRFAASVLLSLVLGAAAAAGEGIATADGGRYVGPVRHGRFDGEGEMRWSSGAHYKGGFEEGVLSGRGRLTLPDGSVYEGSFRNGMLNGEGRVKTPDGTVREGWFRHGLLHGQGRATGPDGDYSGAFRDGRYSGRGELALADGSRYRGEFSLGRFHGQGRLESPTGDVYDGHFERDQFSGKGILVSADGGRHEGEFLRWRPHGKGRYVAPDGTIYEGSFDGGELSGPGHIAYVDGSEYRGDLVAWQPHGQGVMRLANGDEYTGEFADGAFEGSGVMRFAQPRDGLDRLAGRWHAGRPVDDARQAQQLAALEDLLYTEPQRLGTALAALEPQNPAAIDMYLLTVAGDGTQEVFARETAFVRTMFDQRYGTRGHSIALTNGRGSTGRLPVATVSSIRRAVAAIAARMDPEQDILLLYLTSHGSPQRQFSLAQPAFDLPDLSADELAEVLRNSHIRWRVVILSACYSGGFIDALRDPGTLVITAARHDRRSFGCADENEFTYFGRAFFKDALPASGSFEDAFGRAERLVREREMALLARTGGIDEREFSLPQMVAPDPIRAQLRRWWSARRALRARDGDQSPREASASPSFSIR